MFKSTFKNACAMWKVAFILAISIFSNLALAFDSNMQMTGASFSNACALADESWNSFCNGYIQAVVDSTLESDGICLPQGTSRTDLVTVAEREITASSQLREMNAHKAVVSVLQRIYPCR